MNMKLLLQISILSFIVWIFSLMILKSEEIKSLVVFDEEQSHYVYQYFFPKTDIVEIFFDGDDELITNISVVNSKGYDIVYDKNKIIINNFDFENNDTFVLTFKSLFNPEDNIMYLKNLENDVKEVSIQIPARKKNNNRIFVRRKSTGIKMDDFFHSHHSFFRTIAPVVETPTDP